MKRDGAGNKFGFVKLYKIKDVDFWIDTLKEVRIQGAVINVNLAKFNRDGSKTEKVENGERISVFSRLNRAAPFDHGGQKIVNDHGGQKGVNVSMRKEFGGHHLHGGKSYCSVVKNKKDARVPLDGKVVELPPLNTESKKKLEFKSLVGEAKDIDTLNNLKDLLEEGLNLRYLGGLKVLISFNSVKDADEYLRQRVEVFDRVAWIKVHGVPISLWDRHVFNRIGEICGRLLVKSEASVDDGNMVEDRMEILVNTGRRVSEEINLVWKDHSLKVWVEEIDGQWCPTFLDKLSKDADEESAMSSPVLNGVDEKSADFVGGQSKGYSEANPSPCMGNQNCFPSPHAHAAEVAQEFGDQGLEFVGINEEGENVGGECSSGASPLSNNVGPCEEPSRPSYCNTSNFCVQ
ncbi:hypothetical protein HanRHA438_Chr04g0192211 [Helianthus annuus]|nr:hypothetical protein HanRHA438_Chr04g0192211 [Helianthus annuus]